MVKIPSLEDLKKIDVASLVGKVAKAVDGSATLDSLDPADAMGQRIAEAEKLLNEVAEAQKAHAEKLALVHQQLIGIFSDLGRIREEAGATASEESGSKTETDPVDESSVDAGESSLNEDHESK